MARNVHRLALLSLVLVLTGTTAAGAAASQQITIVMREYTYDPARITLQAGVPAVLTLVNKGKKPHEFMVYNVPMGGMMMGHEWVEKTNYFKGITVKAQGGHMRARGGAFFEMEVAAGKTATLAFTPTRKGTFEFGCMIKGHYEEGQKGVLIVQ